MDIGYGANTATVSVNIVIIITGKFCRGHRGCTIEILVMQAQQEHLFRPILVPFLEVAIQIVQGLLNGSTAGAVPQLVQPQ